VNWMKGFDENGRPVRAPGKIVSAEGAGIVPYDQATNWNPPSYSPSTGLFYIPSREIGTDERGVVLRAQSYSAVRAFDPTTGEKRWESKTNVIPSLAGVLTTASDLLFSGLADGSFYALEARTGQPLWKASLGGAVQNGPISYAIGGKQYIAVAAGNSLFTFAVK